MHARKSAYRSTPGWRVSHGCFLGGDHIAVLRAGRRGRGRTRGKQSKPILIVWPDSVVCAWSCVAGACRRDKREHGFVRRALTADRGSVAFCRRRVDDSVRRVFCDPGLTGRSASRGASSYVWLSSQSRPRFSEAQSASRSSCGATRICTAVTCEARGCTTAGHCPSTRLQRRLRTDCCSSAA